ncbi:polysaccharide biosynthesis tyrosine autokinase [Paraburkholderia sp. J7]|uniref:polysaccharide biosynthesis tyrosine autokinase n=1 Tax=Paraburkholderia sp. J7 TaxID=2805438 RepID=UPI002AB7EDD8|nr:polysaccharide biosynthesis tyrosine autokinase [Paraburkholderia sp. J7]
MHLPTENPKNSAQTDGTELVEVLDLLFENRWLIATITCIAVLLGATYAILAEPVYRADILVQVQDPTGATAAQGLLGDVSSIFDVKSSAAAETQILASRLVVSRTVDNLNLFIKAEPQRLPVIGQWIGRLNHGLSTPGLFGLGGFTWGQEAIQVTRFDVPLKFEGDKFWLTVLEGGRYTLTGSDLDAPLEGLAGKIETFKTADGPIILSVQGWDAKPGATFKLIRKSRLKTIQTIQDALDVQERIKQSDVMVASLDDTDAKRAADTMNEIGRQYLQQNVERKSAEAAQSLKFLNEQIPHLRDQLTQAENRLTDFNTAHGAIDLSEQAKLTLARTTDAETRLLELRQKRQDLLAHYTAQHPAVVAIDEQIATLNTYRDEANQSVRTLPALQQESVRRMLDVKLDTDLYTALLNNIAQLQLIHAGKVGDVRLVDTAAVPEESVKPKRLLICLASLMLGLIAGCAAAVVRSTLFKGISDPHEIEQFLSIPVCATIPRSAVQRKLEKIHGRPKLLAISAPDDPAIESLRSLRTSIVLGMADARNNILLITGPTPGIGKSFISANLACVIAQSGKRVMLIDADIRKGHLHSAFGLERSRGLTEVVTGALTAKDVIHSNVVDRVDFISTGKRPSNPSELLAGRSVAQLIAGLASEYDVVLIDSPPVLAVSDTAALVALAGDTLLVAHSGITRLGEIVECVKRLFASDLRLRGVVFNGVNPKSPRSRYGSKYGSYRYVAYEYGSESDD